MITVATGTIGTRSTYIYERPERAGEGTLFSYKD